jgi:hypothetical protein
MIFFLVVNGSVFAELPQKKMQFRHNRTDILIAN